MSKISGLLATATIVTNSLLFNAEASQTTAPLRENLFKTTEYSNIPNDYENNSGDVTLNKSDPLKVCTKDFRKAEMSVNLNITIYDERLDPEVSIGVERALEKYYQNLEQNFRNAMSDVKQFNTQEARKKIDEVQMEDQQNNQHILYDDLSYALGTTPFSGTIAFGNTSIEESPDCGL